MSDFHSFLLFRSFWKSDHSFCHSFWKSDHSFCRSFWKSNRSFGGSFEKSKKMIAHMLFLKEQMSKRLLNRSFEKSGNEQMKMCKKVRIFKSHFFAHFKKNKNTFPHRTFLTFQKCDQTIALLKSAMKRAIALSHFWKVRNVWCVIVLFKVRKKVWFENLHFFAHFCSFQKCDCAIFCTVEKSKKVQSHNHTLEKCDCTIALLKSATKSAIVQSHL